MKGIIIINLQHTSRITRKNAKRYPFCVAKSGGEKRCARKVEYAKVIEYSAWRFYVLIARSGSHCLRLPTTIRATTEVSCATHSVHNK